MQRLRVIERVRDVMDVQMPPFANGDVMDQPTFHTLFETMHENFRAELIEGVVHIPSPRVTVSHGKAHMMLTGWAGTYSAEAGQYVLAGTNSTLILATDSEPQPDLTVFIPREAGGQTTTSLGGYVTGAPELVIEIANSPVSMEFHSKRRMFERYGVLEYLIADVKSHVIHWFVRRREKFVPLEPAADGLLKSKVFPGLWLEPAAVFERSAKRMLAVLQLGLATPEHAKFAAKLQAKLSKAKR